jgi:hypothetical protein
MKLSLYPYSKSVMALTSATRTNGTANGTTVDKLQAGAGDYNNVMFVVTSGAITDGSHAFTIEDSDNGSAWSAAAATDIQGSLPTLTSTNDDVIRDFGYRGTRRYVRVVATTTSATTGGVFSCVAVLFDTAGWRR